MKKADLQRRVDFLLLQLKTINEIVTSDTKDNTELHQNLGAITFYSSPKAIKDDLSFIENKNLQYNFYHKTKNIDDYKLD